MAEKTWAPRPDKVKAYLYAGPNKIFGPAGRIGLQAEKPSGSGDPDVASDGGTLLAHSAVLLCCAHMLRPMLCYYAVYYLVML